MGIPLCVTTPVATSMTSQKSANAVPFVERCKKRVWSAFHHMFLA